MGSIATRRERVVLDIESNAAAVMTKDAAAAALLKRELNSLSGTSVQTSRTLSRDSSISKMGKDSETSGKQIDRLSGRLALFAQAAAVLGPALAPLGAPLVTVMAGLTAQMGAVAGSVGVAVLAFKGMGDGLKAVNKYQLEPTAENLQAMRIEMEKLGPAGAEFVRYLDSLGPELSSLQMAAREGLLPGATEGLEELVTMLPRVRSIVTDLAEAMGGLAGDAGADLAGPEWERFFQYLDTEAGPLLTEFGQTVGNFANGFANMIVAFDPLTDSFSGGFLKMSESFAQWSSTLDSNDSFQGFLDYVQESGPKAMAFLGALVDALASIVSAAAPVGDVVLPILTSMLDTIGALASTDLGTMFFAAAAGMSVYSRAATLVAAANTRMAGSALLSWGQTKTLAAGIGIAALSMTDLDDKAGLSNTAMLGLAGSIAGPWGAAAGAGIGLTMDLAAANDDLAAAVDAANKVMDEGGTDTQIRRNIKAVREEIAATEDALSEGFFSMDKPKQMLTGLNEVLGIFGPNTDDARAAIVGLKGSMGSTIPLAELLGGQIGMTAQQLRVATGDAQAFSGALAQMAGWLDKRAALRAYQEELAKFGKALENGFQPKNVEGLDRVANGILQVATQIKNVEVRKDFMANARASLIEFAGTGPKAEAAVGKVIDQFVKLGLMEPIVEVEADTKGADNKLDRTKGKARDLDNFRVAPGVDAKTETADRKLTATQRLARELAGLPINPRVNVESAAANAAIAAIKRHLLDLNGTTATTFIRVQRLGESGIGPTRGNTSSAMGDIFNGHQPQIARGHTRVWAEPETGGEAYIPLRNDHRRPRAKSIAAETVSLLGGQVSWFAGGGLAGYRSSRGDNWSGMSGDVLAPELTAFNDNLALSGVFLRNELRERMRLLEKEKEAGKARLDAIKAERDSLMESVKARLTSNIWEKRAAIEFERPDNWDQMSRDDRWAWEQQNAQINAFQQGTPEDILKADIAQAREMAQLLQQLKNKGLNGQAFLDLQQNADMDQIRAYASGSRADIAEYERLYNQRSQAVSQTVGVAAMTSGLTSEFRAARREYVETTQELRQANQRLERAIKQAEKVEAAVKKVGDDVADALDKPGARAGRR